MTLQKYCRSYQYDKGLNMRQQGFGQGTSPKRMFVSTNSNRTIGANLYNNLAPARQLMLNQNIDSFFDTHGNQLTTGDPALQNSWDCNNMLQRTVRKDEQVGEIVEHNVYAAPGRRSKKITETINKDGETTKIEEAIYLNNLEYRTTWKGDNLSYDGVTVTDGSGNVMAPYEKYHSLRIREGHKQVAQKDVYTIKDGQTIKESKTHTHFTLDNNIDSCQAQLDGNGNLKSYRAYYPYGDTSISSGELGTQKTQYSGQEKDDTGLYNYGFRSYLPDNFRWLSPDPIGMEGSGLNLYAMVMGNPVTHQDMYGLTLKIFEIVGCDHSNTAGVEEGSFKFAIQAVAAAMNSHIVLLPVESPRMTHYEDGRSIQHEFNLHSFKRLERLEAGYARINFLAGGYVRRRLQMRTLNIITNLVADYHGLNNSKSYDIDPNELQGLTYLRLAYANIKKLNHKLAFKMVFFYAGIGLDYVPRKFFHKGIIEETKMMHKEWSDLFCFDIAYLGLANTNTAIEEYNSLVLDKYKANPMKIKNIHQLADLISRKSSFITKLKMKVAGNKMMTVHAESHVGFYQLSGIATRSDFTVNIVGFVGSSHLTLWWNKENYHIINVRTGPVVVTKASVDLLGAQHKLNIDEAHMFGSVKGISGKVLSGGGKYNHKRISKDWTELKRK